MTAEQIPLLGQRPRRRRAARERPAAAHQPVARVALMTPVPHLDRVFDYAVPDDLSDVALPGARVRVRLAGRLMDGFILERTEASDRDLVPLSSVHGPPVLTDEVAALCRAVADRYAGTLADVLRFAVPPRHARAESRPPRGRPEPPAGPVPVDGWAAYGGGAALLDRIGAAAPTRALWVAAPGEDVPARIAELAHGCALRGRGVIVVAPDGREVDRIGAGLEAAGLSPIRLVAGTGPEARYRAFLAVRQGAGRVVLGTRSAVFAPVADLGAIIVWDDADESLAEPQAPGWHAREVAALRSTSAQVSLVIGGTGVSLEAARMAQSGWLRPVELARPAVRARMPRVQVSADLARGDPDQEQARVPSAVLGALREGLEVGPVLVSVPRAGYLPVLACQGCRESARCPECATTLAAGGPDRVPTCAVHGPQPAWQCPICGSDRIRAVVVGVRRTAEEFGRALPGVRVVASSGADQVRALPSGQALVVATPGAEPDPGPAGFAVLVLMDARAALSRPGLRTAEAVLHRWLSAATRVRPAAAGGRVLVVGDPGVREVQALVRWDPAGYAARELAERRQLHLPPAVRTARLTGSALPTGELVDEVGDRLGDRLLRRSGPLAGPEAAVTWLLAVAIADGPRLAAALKEAQSARSARRAPVVTVRMDPTELG